MILCRRHHRINDDAWKNYPPAILFRWKEKHESRYVGFSAAVDLSVSYSHLPHKAYRYVRREDVQEEIYERLQGMAKVVVSGVSGCGKTQEALSYFQESTAEYTFRWWVRGHDEITTLTDLAAIGPYVGLAQVDGEPVVDYVRRVLVRLEGISGWLIVFDNVEDSGIERLLPSSGGHVIVTTKASSWTSAKLLYRLPKLTMQQASAIMLSAGEGLPAAIMEEIYAATVGHPLALDQAASFIADTGMPAEAYLELLRSERAELLGRGVMGADSFSSLILSVLKRVDEQALGLLKTLTFVASTPITLVVSGSDAPFTSFVPKKLLEIEDCIAWLRSNSLLERHGNLVSTHELIQDVVRWSLVGVDRKRSLMSAVQLLTDQLPERTTDVAAWPVVELLMPHCMAVINHLSAESIHPAGITYFYNRLAPYLMQRGQRAEAERMLRGALDLLRGHNDESAESSRASLMHNLARLVADQDGGIESASLYEKSLAIKLRLYGPDHVLTAIGFGAFGTLREAQGLLGEAEELFEKSRRVYEREGDQRRLIESISDLSRNRFKMRDLRGSLMLAQEAVEKAVGDREWNEAVESHLMLATVHRDSGNLVEAARVLRVGQNIARQSQLLSPNLARTLFRRGEVLADLGVSESASALLSEGLHMMERLAVEPTPEIAVFKFNYGLFLLRTDVPPFAVRDLFAEARKHLAGLSAREQSLEKSARELQAYCETEMGNEAEAARLLEDGDPRPSFERFYAHFGFKFHREGNRLIMYGM
ncbi:tetratricopeptide repeat protein [Lentzea sp. NPDC058450]|uniref:tetratricopeptide repeat protein n=1 Tax=Lentzea sp. NPDC058450 TaxID=3346505 RepID=UPI0036662369